MKKLQCPHCLTDYSITDDQLRQSQGIVRCGHCLETFDANVELNKDKPTFDPRSAFIEPLSHFEDENDNIVLDELLPDSRSVAFKDESLKPVTFEKIGATTSENQEITQHEVMDLDEILKHQIPSDKVLESTTIIEEPVRPRLNEGALKSIQASIDPELSVHLYDDDEMSSEQIDEESHFVEQASEVMSESHVMDMSTFLDNDNQEPITEASIQFIDNHEIEEPSIQLAGSSTLGQTGDLFSADPQQTKTEPTIDQPQKINEISSDDFEEQTSETVMLENDPVDNINYDENQQDDELIDEVDELIDNKLINKPDTDNFEDLLLTQAPTKKTSWLAVLFFSPLLLLIIALLISILLFQLWQKQFISWPDRQDVQHLIAPLIVPITKQLEAFEITIPKRRNLNALQLLSAKTEAHPTRSSTILLRVSLINRAVIEQPLPWLELSLNNSEGKIISRRSLSPDDYIHNNRTSSSIGSNELKKITVELLSFPKQAAGYELKLLNK